MNKEFMYAYFDWCGDTEFGLAKEPITPPFPGYAAVTKWGDRFVVEFDYGVGNMRSFDTYEQARLEAVRLWVNGEASRIEDKIALARPV
ncbi:hypothetical protein JZX86_18080 [Agrobacterium rosae]|uniref:hypothetical protein n=1 Tax=Agrobacterium rosae TaxID=1972867 RepID=UPI0019D34F00|nr:hypothetical protein [Agrobacterium rosae]MBN7807265.1 hypothetical protein [Agrobacterium rosae]